MHLMKGEEYMGKDIQVILLEEDGVDYIRFLLSETETENINLNSNIQTSLRDVYKKMIVMSMTDKLVLKLEYQEGYSKILFKEIAVEFINDLNKELDAIYSDIISSNLQES